VDRRRLAVTLAFVAGSFMNVLDSTIVNVALPSIDHGFHVPASGGTLTVVSYLTMLVVVMPISGWLVDRFGTRRVFLIALATFTAASALCGVAQSLPELVAARVLQGMGGGAMLPAGMTMLYRAYTPAERLRLARVITIPTSLGPVLGPTLGGVLVQELSWRWVFWVNVPVGMGALIVSWLLLEEHVEQPRERLDLLGFALAAIGIGALIYAIAEGSSAGWSSPRIVGCLTVGVLLCVALVFVERSTTSPLLRLDLIRITDFRHSLAITALCGSAFTGMLFLVPLMLQIGDGYSPIQSGTSTFAEAIGVAVVSQIVSRIHGRFGERRLQLGGFALLTSLIVVFAIAGHGMSLWAVRALMFGVGIGSGSVQLLNQAMAFDGVGPADTGRASGLYNMSRRLGGATGVALLGSLLASTHTTGGAESGFSAAYVAGAVLAGTGLICALRASRTGGRLSTGPIAAAAGVPAAASGPSTRAGSGVQRDPRHP
jgi:EmrB/QacA subfamily drug resistance transporter